MVKVKRRPDEFHPPYYDLDGYYLSLDTPGTAKVYEEGTWIPTISFGGSSAGVTYSAQNGQFIRIGDLVYARFALVLTSNGTGVGAASVGGLPFAAATQSVLAAVIWGGCASVVGNPYAATAASSTSVSLQMSGASSNVAMTDTNITNTATLVMSGCYQAA